MIYCGKLQGLVVKLAKFILFLLELRWFLSGRLARQVEPLDAELHPRADHGAHGPDESIPVSLVW
jgi:hypothetical protein